MPPGPLKHRLLALARKILPGLPEPPPYDTAPPPRVPIERLRTGFGSPATTRERVQPIPSEDGGVELRVTGTSRKHLEETPVRLPRDLNPPDPDAPVQLPETPQLSLPDHVEWEVESEPEPLPVLEPATPPIAVPWHQRVPWKSLAILLALALLITSIGWKRAADYLRAHLRPKKEKEWGQKYRSDPRPPPPITAIPLGSLELDRQTRLFVELYTGHFHQAGFGGKPEQALALIAQAAAEPDATGLFLVRIAEVARAELRRANLPSKQIPPALAPLFDRALELNANEPEVLIRTSDFRIEQGRLDEGLALLERALELDPTDNGAKKKLISARIAAGQHDQAARLFEEMIRDDPSSPAAREALASYLAELGRYEKAVTAYRDLLAVDPGNLPAITRTIDLLLNRLGRPAEALDLASATVDRLPESPEARYQLAITEIANGRWAEARRSLETTRDQLQATRIDLTDQAFFNYYATALEQTGDVSAAETNYRKAIELGRESAAEARNNLAFLLARQNRSLAEARDLVEDALAATGPRPDFLDTLGLVLQGLGQHARAVEQFQSALLLSRTPHPDLLRHLGESQLALGDTAAAAQSWTLALELRPNDPALRSRLATLRKTDPRQSPPPSPTSPPNP